MCGVTKAIPGTVTDLLTRTGGDPASAETGPALNQTPATSSGTGSGFTRLPILRKTDAGHGVGPHGGKGAGLARAGGPGRAGRVRRS
jgi:hypothetical protein